MTDTLKAALEAYKPQLTVRYTNFITDSFAQLTERLGEGLPGLGNSGRWSFFQKTMVQYVTGDRKTINPARLAGGASLYADGVIAAWYAKITLKMGDIDNAECLHLDGMRFRIRGTCKGVPVRIEQDMILNFSSMGTPFNQFPARIYVDGKFMSAAAFAKWRAE